MTNKKQLIIALSLTAILVTGTFNLTPLAYSTGWNHDDDDDDRDDKIKICHIPPGNPDKAHTITISKAAWDAHKEHGDHKDECNDDHDDGEDCECKKPTIFTVKYNGPGIPSGTGSNAPVTIEIYKKTDDIGKKPPLLTIPDIINDSPIVVNSNTFGKETLEANTIYRVMQNGVQIAIVSIHTSCSQPLFIGSIYRDSANIVTLTVESGTNSEGKQSIFLEHDPICEGVTLTVTKILEPPEDIGRFILQIDGVDKSAPVGNGETTGPVLVMPGLHTVSEIASSGTNLDDYTRTITGDCNPDGTIELEKGDNAECIIANTKIKPSTITLKKVVTQDNTDETNEIDLEVENPFHLIITNTGTGIEYEINEPNEIVPPGTYTLREEIDEEYKDVFDFVLISGDDGCPTMIQDMEEFTLSSEQHLTCVVYNEDDANAATGGNGIIFRNHSMKIQIDDNTVHDSCDRFNSEPDPGALKNSCIEILDPSDDTIGIVDSALTSDTTIVLFSVVEADALGSIGEAPTPTCVVTAIVKHNNVSSLYLVDETDMDSTPTSPSNNNVVVLQCLNIQESKTYNVNYVMIDPLL